MENQYLMDFPFFHTSPTFLAFILIPHLPVDSCGDVLAKRKPVSKGGGRSRRPPPRSDNRLRHWELGCLNGSKSFPSLTPGSQPCCHCVGRFVSERMEPQSVQHLCSPGFKSALLSFQPTRRPPALRHSTPSGQRAASDRWS